MRGQEADRLEERTKKKTVLERKKKKSELERKKLDATISIYKKGQRMKSREQRIRRSERRRKEKSGEET